MTVVASFTADVTSGVSPLTVTFTDTSTGSPTKWLWTFGDGSYSDEQHPVHIYTEDGVYDVKLTALIVSASSAISMTNYGDGNQFIQSSGTTNAEAFGNLGSSWASGGSSAGEFLVFNDPDSFGYGMRRQHLEFTLPSSPSGAGPSSYVIESKVSTDLYIFVPEVVISSSKGGLHTGTVGGIYGLFRDVTALAGTTEQAIYAPAQEAIVLPDPLSPPDNITGNNAQFRVRELETASSDNFDTETKVDYITVGIVGDPPIASFTAVPTAGVSPLDVQFNNTSIEATEGETTYSWKKRLSGSGDSFVEFSTEKHPSEIFTK